MKNYIFGDTGGHAKQLYASLIELGVDLETHQIPSDVRIIHLGDLIHKGPSTVSLLHLVDKLIRNNPGQWIQLLGNHEFQHIEGAPYFWRCTCSIDEENIIYDWYEEGLATPTFGIDVIKDIKLEVSNRPKTLPDVNKGIFFSHAGLTYNWWVNYGGKDLSPSKVSERINQLPVDIVTQAGEMLFGYEGRTPNVGPVWALGNTEVFESWLNHPKTDMPFMQFHGHTSSYSFSRGSWWGTGPLMKNFRSHSKLNPENRTVICNLNNNFLVGIDPGYSKTADGVKQPYQSFIS